MSSQKGLKQIGVICMTDGSTLTKNYHRSEYNFQSRKEKDSLKIFPNMSPTEKHWLESSKKFLIESNLIFWKNALILCGINLTSSFIKSYFDLESSF